MHVYCIGYSHLPSFKTRIKRAYFKYLVIASELISTGNYKIKPYGFLVLNLLTKKAIRVLKYGFQFVYLTFCLDRQFYILERHV